MAEKRGGAVRVLADRSFQALSRSIVPNLRYFSKTIVYSSGKPVMAFTRDQTVVNKICIMERAERKKDTAGASSNDRVIGIVNAVIKNLFHN